MFKYKILKHEKLKKYQARRKMLAKIICAFYIFAEKTLIDTQSEREFRKNSITSMVEKVRGDNEGRI